MKCGNVTDMPRTYKVSLLPPWYTRFLISPWNIEIFTISHHIRKSWTLILLLFCLQESPLQIITPKIDEVLEKFRQRAMASSGTTDSTTEQDERRDVRVTVMKQSQVCLILNLPEKNLSSMDFVYYNNGAKLWFCNV